MDVRHLDGIPGCLGFALKNVTKHFRYLKWRYENLYKQYGYGLCKGKPTSKIAEHKAQETLHFRYLKCLGKNGRNFNGAFLKRWVPWRIMDQVIQVVTFLSLIWRSRHFFTIPKRAQRIAREKIFQLFSKL